MSTEQRDETILEVIMRAYDSEWEQKERIDDKFNNFMTIAATIATLYMGIGFFVLETISPQNQFHTYLVIVLLIGTGLFIADVAVSLYGYRPLKYHVSPKDAIKLIEEYKDLSKTHVTRTVAATLAEAVNLNMEVNLRKTKVLKWVFRIMMCGMITIFVFTVFLILALRAPPVVIS